MIWSYVRTRGVQMKKFNEMNVLSITFCRENADMKEGMLEYGKSSGDREAGF